MLNLFPALKHLPGDVFNYKKVITNTKLLHSALLQPQVESHMNRSPDDDRKDFISLYIKQMRELREKGRPSSIDGMLTSVLLLLLFVVVVVVWFILFIIHIQNLC